MFSPVIASLPPKFINTVPSPSIIPKIQWSIYPEKADENMTAVEAAQALRISFRTELKLKEAIPLTMKGAPQHHFPTGTPEPCSFIGAQEKLRSFSSSHSQGKPWMRGQGRVGKRIHHSSGAFRCWESTEICGRLCIFLQNGHNPAQAELSHIWCFWFSD